MDYKKKYAIDPSFITDGSVKWTSTGSGVFILGEHKGHTYFIKRYTMGPRVPDKSIAEPAYSEMMNAAKWLEDKQKEIAKRFSKLSVDGDQIVVEEENFWDDDNLFVTITRMIPGENKGFDYTTLDQATFVRLCVDMTILLKKIHDAGVTHGDLKEKNILIQNSGGTLIPYLIDFDSSYPSDYGTRTRADGKPMLSWPVVYSEGYQSPEIALYNYEDEGVIDAATITNKTDIFTMGVIFHRLWAGDFPAVIGESCAVGEAICTDQEIQLSSKFQVALGGNNNCLFSDLIMWMLEKDPANRPTAAQVIDALQDALDISDYFDGCTGGGTYDTDPHALHANAIEIASKDELKKMDVKSMRKGTVGGQYKYLIKLKDGSELTLTVDEMIDRGYAKAKDTLVSDMWPADAEKYEFVDVADIAAAGVLRIEQAQAGYKKFYSVRMRKGGGYTTSAVGLVDRGLARPKVIAASSVGVSDSPWPEHGASYNTEALQARRVINVERVTEEGENRYKLTTRMGDGSTRENVVKAGYMKIMKFIV
jgi:hypothetical protein